MQDLDTVKPGAEAPPPGTTAAIVLADGSIFWGSGFGATGDALGEICFNTSMSGYEEILTDPSYAAQIVTFTFPHIGIVGTNKEDIESLKPAARGLIVREDITEPSSWRNVEHFDSWLKSHNLVGISGIDTRALTQRIRDLGAPNGVIAHHPDGRFDLPALLGRAKQWPGLDGMDLAKEVSCTAPYEWTEELFSLSSRAERVTRSGGIFAESTREGPSTPLRSGRDDNKKPHVVAIDYGAKRNILRCLASSGCRVTVVPATTGSAEILALKPDGIFLSNGPGDPAATGIYAVPVIQDLLKTDLPIFGICLGHQLLGLALGGRTEKMKLGHRGGNQPVKDLDTGKVEITSQNHGFCVIDSSLPPEAIVTHISLFDQSNEGLRLKDRPVFSVQYHPEASPGPTDSHHLFHRFRAMMAA